MASLLSHRSVVEICTFIPEDEYASLPNGEWRFKAEHCVVREDWDDAGDLPPPEYFSSDGFHIATGKHSLSESLDIVFSPGEPLMLWRATPKGFIEGLLKVELKCVFFSLTQFNSICRQHVCKFSAIKRSARSP